MRQTGKTNQLSHDLHEFQVTQQQADYLDFGA